jgi:recombinase
MVVRHRLARDDERADTVGVIFSWFVRDGLGRAGIVARLAADAERYRPPVDHRTGELRAWTSAVVNGILNNPAYFGYVVRGRTRRGRPQPEERWIWSLSPSHPPLVDEVMWWEARDRLHPMSLPPSDSRTDDAAVGGAETSSGEAA